MTISREINEKNPNKKRELLSLMLIGRPSTNLIILLEDWQWKGRKHFSPA